MVLLNSENVSHSLDSTTPERKTIISCNTSLILQFSGYLQYCCRKNFNPNKNSSQFLYKTLLKATSTLKCFQNFPNAGFHKQVTNIQRSKVNYTKVENIQNVTYNKLRNFMDYGLIKNTISFINIKHSTRI